MTDKRLSLPFYNEQLQIESYRTGHLLLQNLILKSKSEFQSLIDRDPTAFSVAARALYIHEILDDS